MKIKETKNVNIISINQTMNAGTEMQSTKKKDSKWRD